MPTNPRQFPLEPGSGLLTAADGSPHGHSGARVLEALEIDALHGDVDQGQPVGEAGGAHGITADDALGRLLAATNDVLFTLLHGGGGTRKREPLLPALTPRGGNDSEG